MALVDDDQAKPLAKFLVGLGTGGVQRFCRAPMVAIQMVRLRCSRNLMETVEG